MTHKSIIKTLVFICLFLSGCENKISLSDSQDSDASKKSSQEITERLANIDVASLKGLEDVFSNNVEISSSDKPIMLVFGNNACKYCEDLKNEIRNNAELKSYIKNSVKSYYINTSYSKNHAVAYLHKTMDTDSLSRYYNLSNTPLVLFLEPNGDLIIKMIGYNRDFFPKMVEFSADSNNYKDVKDSSKRMQLFSQKYIDNA